MNTITILLGGNIGNTKLYIYDAEKLLIDQIGPIQKSSSIYESEPWGFESEQWFLNKVVQVTSYKLQVTSYELQVSSVLAICKGIENALGRSEKTSTGYESRIIDIDILFFDNEIINLPNLIIPHLKLHERRFTLLPLQEIMNDFIHPVFNKSIDELLISCKDNGTCRKLIE